ncbi:hypothetical protein FisN_20Lh014 [Fistulifera solaris]|uniref:Aminomethyltransferase folate-binding domain-containing protein n=1 Tax=Fistulifera solaris TaxID=1519565 RepID=A0A1Z5JW39_FISSO|nr:hypothetical protein FisN_20Lh014 [Fistulifera solaris]|eukprot:GAX18255.1 hypothetical protein FisN_20Lh014 [Fistulifera solaris]
MMLLTIYLLLSVLAECQGFTSPLSCRSPASFGKKYSTSALSLSSAAGGNEHKENAYWTSLTSPFPPETPSGLRGEAIIRALQSGRTVVFQPPHNLSFVVRGKGAEHFLNQKLSQRISLSNASFHRAAILNRKGHVLDIVGVASVNATYAVVFPTHLNLQEHWGPTIFPLDQVTVEASPSSVQCISLFSSRHWHIQKVWERSLRHDKQPSRLSRTKTEYFHQTSQQSSSSSPQVLLTTPGSIWWPSHTVAASYTMLVSSSEPLQKCLFLDDSVASSNNNSPMWLGEREYQALRIVSGQPSFVASVTFPAATVLEWELSPLVDFEKGCYLGQERVAAQSGNPLPQSLYQIEFLEEENNDFVSLQRWPTGNDTVYVLGTNEELTAGKIVEMAEPASQGTPAMLGLAMVKRANSLLRRMEQLELDVPRPQTNDDSLVESSSGTRDKLDGLEVIVNGELIGRLKTLPFKRLGQDKFLIDDTEQAPDEAVVEMEKSEAVDARKETEEMNSSESMPSPTANVDSQAERERKEAKMELLRQRAEEALARRQQKKSTAT